MSRELEFTGWWEGEACYSCENCGKTAKFPFDNEEFAKDARRHRAILKKKEGWMVEKVNGFFHDFCSEDCRNRYIRNNTI